MQDHDKDSFTLVKEELMRIVELFGGDLIDDNGSITLQFGAKLELQQAKVIAIAARSVLTTADSLGAKYFNGSFVFNEVKSSNIRIGYKIQLSGFNSEKPFNKNDFDLLNKKINEISEQVHAAEKKAQLDESMIRLQSSLMTLIPDAIKVDRSSIVRSTIENDRVAIHWDTIANSSLYLNILKSNIIEAAQCGEACCKIDSSNEKWDKIEVDVQSISPLLLDFPKMRELATTIALAFLERKKQLAITCGELGSVAGPVSLQVVRQSDAPEQTIEKAEIKVEGGSSTVAPAPASVEPLLVSPAEQKPASEQAPQPAQNVEQKAVDEKKDDSSQSTPDSKSAFFNANSAKQNSQPAVASTPAVKPVNSSVNQENKCVLL